MPSLRAIDETESLNTSIIENDECETGQVSLFSGHFASTAHFKKLFRGKTDQLKNILDYFLFFSLPLSPKPRPAWFAEHVPFIYFLFFNSIKIFNSVNAFCAPGGGLYSAVT